MKRKYKKQVNKELEELDKKLELFERKWNLIVLVWAAFCFGVVVGATIVKYQYNLG
jgi:intracellular septation protein A